MDGKSLTVPLFHHVHQILPSKLPKTMIQSLSHQTGLLVSMPSRLLQQQVSIRFNELEHIKRKMNKLGIVID
jgi:hypothetical protein